MIVALLLMAAEVPVLVRDVPRGELLSAADFQLEERAAPIPHLPRPDEILGKETLRPLSAGTIVGARDVAAPRLVKRGEAVTLRIRSAGLLISTPGRALADGRHGDTVRVLATTTRRTLEGQVEGPSSVLIAAP